MYVYLHFGAIHLSCLSSVRRRKFPGKRSYRWIGLHRSGLLSLWELHFTLHSLSRQEKDNWNSIWHNANDLKHRPRLLPSHQWLSNPKKRIQSLISFLCLDRRIRNTDFDLPFLHSWQIQKETRQSKQIRNEGVTGRSGRTYLHCILKRICELSRKGKRNINHKSTIRRYEC